MSCSMPPFLEFYIREIQVKKIFSGCVAFAFSCVSAAGVLSGTPLSERIDIHATLLYLQPESTNLKYAVFVAGTQPYQQSWHYQTLRPDFSPAFELGLTYRTEAPGYQANVEWLHLQSSDSDFKQAAEGTALSNIEFVSPPFEVGPPVFGIKRADSTVNFSFDKVDINLEHLFKAHAHLQAKLLGGLDLLRIHQTITTVFSDYPGALPTAYSYALPPDPNYTFQLQNTSTYSGLGPDLGLYVQYQLKQGIGVMGQLVGLLTVGTMKVADNFMSTSTRLINQGLNPSYQEITTPNATQVVPGFDGKLGLFYTYSGNYISNLKVELGYRLGSLNDAISQVVPNTLVQPGTDNSTPDFATGTMAIESVASQNMNFSYNGPYIDFRLLLD